MTVLYVNAAAGVAGDMLLGALVDAGADRAAVVAALAGLGVDGYAVTFEATQRGGIAATWANVVVDDHGARPDLGDDDGHGHPHHAGHVHRPAKEVRRLIEQADLAPRVCERARRVVDALAAAEGEVHGIAA